VLATPREVIRGLITYTDWWQPATASVFEVGAARRSSNGSDGIRPGLLETLDERSELIRRMALLSDRERRVLFLWYLRQLEVAEIAREIRVSRRTCFRIRSRAVQALVEAAEPAA
jgi:DNA-directed RNA polymerase specialized sigma24 family protein